MAEGLLLGCIYCVHVWFLYSSTDLVREGYQVRQASGGLMLCSCSYVSLFPENFISDRASVGVLSAKNRLSWVCCFTEILIYPQLLCGLKFRVLFINHVPQM